ncbi:MAG: hypothetical protein AB7O96_16725 [Pseudobdellovibrionaceae bacterium]
MQQTKSLESLNLASLTASQVENLAASYSDSEAEIQKAEDIGQQIEQEGNQIGGTKLDKFDFYSERLSTLRARSNQKFEALQTTTNKENIHTAETLKLQSSTNPGAPNLSIKFGSMNSNGQFEETLDLLNGLVVQTTYSKAAFCLWLKTGNGLGPMPVQISNFSSELK